MNLKQLNYFIAIADTGSISAAAAKVRIAQSAVSSQVALLEEELGTGLVVRHSRGVHLTVAGRVLLKHARSILTSFDDAKRATREAAREKRGEVKLGLPSGISAGLAVPLIEEGATASPGIEVHVFEGLNADVRGWLSNGELDLAVLYQTEKLLPKGAVPLVEDELVLVGQQIFPKDVLEIPFARLAKLPLVHTARRHGIRNLIDNTARQMGITLSYAAEIDSLSQIRKLVASGKGYSVLTRFSMHFDPFPASIKAYRICKPDLTIKSFIVVNPKSSSALLTHLSKSLRQLAVRLVAEGNWPGGKIFR